MLSPTLDTVRLFLHLLAVATWVGGQIVLAGIVPSLRRLHPESTKTAARAFARVAWTSLLVIVVTGVWNLIDVDVTQATLEYRITVGVHIMFTTGAAGAVALHSFGRSKLSLALGGAFGLLLSLGALFVGLLLRTGA